MAISVPIRMGYELEVKAKVATIEYDARGYDFRIDGLRLALRFDPDCSLASAR